jgi:hypothetical protein
MQEFNIVWSDEQLVTHEFTAGSSATTNQSINPSTGGGAPQSFNQIQSYGVATIDVPGLLKAIANVEAGSVWGDPNAIYQQFGPRPNYDPLNLVAANSPAEFWFAVHEFSNYWAKQFTAKVNLTFMPELYPGMLLVIEELGFQCYITNVTHTFNLATNGGGFSTQVTVIAPSATDGSGLVGLGRSGSPA